MRRTTVLLTCATIGLGVAEPSSAQELPAPMPALEADVAAIVAEVETAVDVELPTLDVSLPTAPTVVDAPSTEPPAVAQTPVETAPTEQYQPAEPQYQAPEEEAQADVEETAAVPVSSAEQTPASESADVAGETTTATGPAVPETWTWNWNWNCEEPASVPAAPENATAWNWNWNWNCDASAIPAIDLDQYQGPTTQYQGGNTNIGIRIASPGDDGPVTQTIQSVTHVITTVVTQVTEVTQSVDQVTQSVLPAVVPPTLPQDLIGPSLPFDVLPIGKPPAIEVVIALPPLVLPALPAIAEVVTGGLIELAPGAPREQRAAPPASRAAQRPSPAAGIATIRQWAPAVPALVSAKHAAPSRPAGSSAPQRDRRLPLPPIPGGAGAGAGQSASAPAFALAALAAALAAYLLVPPLGARRLRRARDRRRLGLLAGPLERPG